MWQHQASVLSKSQGVLLMMRGIAECNARKTVGREYPNQKIHDFRPKKGGVIFLSPPPPTSLKTSKKRVSSAGSRGGSRRKTYWGMCLLDKIRILQGVKLTIQPLGVGYANSPKKAQNGGVCGVFPYIRLPGFDLTTSAR